LPEPSSEIDGCENHASRPAYVADALTDILHGVPVGVGVGIEGQEILY